MGARLLGRLRLPTTPSDRKRTGAESPTPTQTRLRNLNLVAFLPMLLLSGAVTVVVDADAWWEAVVLAIGVLVVLVAFLAWTSGTLQLVVVPCLVTAVSVWIVGVLVAGTPSAFFGLAMVGSFAVPQLRTRRTAATAALVAFVASVGASRLWVTSGNVRAELVEFVVLPAGVTLLATALMFPNKRFYDVVTELEESREREAEMAVIRERIRFASDLHDIQGHTLHVVKLKVALAQKLVGSDTARVEQELREIYQLVSDTIGQTKELAHAQRRLNLAAELENAKNLFEAAGIHVRIVREAESDARTSELLGQVLRETTTNILRHAQATQVRITLSRLGIVIVNDGVRDETLPPLRGLATLRRRVGDEGGELTVRVEDGRFLTAASFEPPADQSIATRRDDA
jgi:two-component system, NarL family, sensor histidine kinase DesK